MELDAKLLHLSLSHSGKNSVQNSWDTKIERFFAGETFHPSKNFIRIIRQQLFDNLLEGGNEKYTVKCVRKTNNNTATSFFTA